MDSGFLKKGTKLLPSIDKQADICKNLRSVLETIIENNGG
jgi:hypothetical protein